MNDVKKLSPKILPIFIDDVMCDNGVNTLLYSSNAHKEIYYSTIKKEKILPFSTTLMDLEGIML